MPIKVPDNLPAISVLETERIFVMNDSRAFTQDIRPLKILILNLMPLKQDTEEQLLRLLGNTALQVEVKFIYMSSYNSKNTSKKHLAEFYSSFEAVKDKKYDGMIITGAPVEKLEFEEVLYWKELVEIFEWSKTNVTSTLHICWGAQASLYYFFGLQKSLLKEKLSGVFKHTRISEPIQLLQGFDEIFHVPHSRYTETILPKHMLEENGVLKILATSPEAGVYLSQTEGGKQIFVTGHCEYDKNTLKNEYLRDLKKDISVKKPENYFKNDTLEVDYINWRGHANLLFSNWLNYYVYQETPYEL